MGVAQDFNSALRQELDVFAAWLPVANTFEVGDYGLISGGIFVKAGNIADLGVSVKTKAGGATNLEFSSKGTTLTRLLGEAKVDVLPNQPVQAKLKVEFERRDSIFAAAANLDISEMASTANVAKELYTSDFDHAYKVVSAVYRAREATIITSKNANSMIELNGTAEALQSLSIGGAAAGVTIGGNRDIGLKILAGSGVVGLRLFRLGVLAERPIVLAPGDDAPIEEISPDRADDDV